MREPRAIRARQPRVRRASTWVLCLIAFVVAVAPPAAGRAHRGVMARLDRTEALLSTHRLADAVRAGAALAGVEVRVAETEPAAPVGDTPPALAAPVTEIVVAVRSAAEQARAALTGTPGAIRPGTIDRSGMFSAGLSLAAVIDRTLPLLRSAAARMPASPAGAAGCDIVDQLPALCIGNTGDNVYTQDVGLLIDLGGNDVYRNSAGGATAIGNQLAASVNIDLAGNDRYEALLPLASGAESVQGSANFGIGILVDEAGDDSYSAVAVCDQCSITARAQGFGAQGVGILADRAGNDTYLISSSVAKPLASASAEGQGYGGLGLGLSLDAGRGNDTREVRASSCWSCLSTTYGFGYGRVGGAGVSYDDGGTDVLSLRAESARLGPGDPDSIYQPYLSALTYGMGYGDDGGAGVQLSGPGDTERVGVAETITPHAGAVGVLGFGYADSSGSFGGLQDEGGDDRYTMQSTSHAIADHVIEDSCGCSGVRAEAISNAILSAGMGATALGGAAVLRDLAGDDRYLGVASSIAEARAHDARTEPVGADSEAIASAAAGAVNVEVMGEGNVGSGILEDGGGDDTYDSRALSQADADATALLDGTVTEASASSGMAQSFGQGAGIVGFGALRDMGGTDSYRSTNVSHAEAVPPTEVIQGSATSFVQGVMLGGGPGNALLLDDGGTADVFSATPPVRVPCTGTRGSEMWMDCGSGFALGINR